MGFCLIPLVTSLSKASFGILIFVFLLSFSRFSSTEAYDALDPNGNITIRWDVISWTPDGYVAVVTINNFQQYRPIEAPGWSLRWTWAKKEVIWSMIGAQATEQGNCSNFTGNIPHSCKKNPTIVDLLPSTPYNKQIAKCCKGGVLSSWVQDPANAIASFQITVGKAGTTDKTVRIPKNFTLNGPGPGYTCGPAKIVRPTRFITPDKRRVTKAAMTWNVTCTYSQFLVHENKPTCCVSLSSFYNDTIVPCPKCSCGCQGNSSTCAKSDSSPRLTPLVQCTNHMCPIQVHWHVQDYYEDFWRVKINITNFNYMMNYSEWNLVIQHPNVDNITSLSGDIYRLTPNGDINDLAMIWVSKGHNDVLNQAGPSGNVETELVIGKGHESNMSLEKGWAFPEALYFNGDKCVMPPSDAYPLTVLPENVSAGANASANSSSSSRFSSSSSSQKEVSLLTLMMYCLVVLVFHTIA